MRNLYIVPHTHWDREWYEPFQGFRSRLVDLIDDLLLILEEDQDFSHFTLDGQTVVLEDYLEVRPEKKESLKKAIAEGRISVGPWYVLPDENLVSGESIIRNLERGLRISEEFMGKGAPHLNTPNGGGSEISFLGYLPDQFGHISSMPKILKSFGINTACLWRGVGSDVDKSVFMWKSLDGSGVLCVYLPHGYGNAASLPFEPSTLRCEIDEIVEKLKPWNTVSVGGRQVEIPYLLMNGSDHQKAQRGLPQALFLALGQTSQVDEKGTRAETTDPSEITLNPEYRWKIATLTTYVREVQSILLTQTGESSSESPGDTAFNPSKQPLIPIHVGELRSCERAPLLVGVTSTRHWIKERDWALSTMLERYAEPLTLMATLLGNDSSASRSYLDLAWKYLLLNQPHDSICGCSVDQVHKDMEYRYDQCQLLVERVIEDGLLAIPNHLALSSFALSPKDLVLFNPGRSHDQAIVEATLEGTSGENTEQELTTNLGERSLFLVDGCGQKYRAQIVSGDGGLFEEEEFSPGQIKFYLRFLRGRRLLGFYINGISLNRISPDAVTISIKTGSEISGELNIEEKKTELLEILKDPRISKVLVRRETPGPRRIVFNPGTLPSLGFKSFRLGSLGLSVQKEFAAEHSLQKNPQVTVNKNILENGYFRVEVQKDGSLRVQDLKENIAYPTINKFVDTGDKGDEYNWDPPLKDTVVESPSPSFLAHSQVRLLADFGDRWPLGKRARVFVEERGPVRGRIRIEMDYLVPESLSPERLERSRRKTLMKITSWVSIYEGIRRIDFKTRVENRAKDQRLRVLFRLPGKANTSLAGCQFENVERRVETSEPAQKGPEVPLGTHPFRRFVYIGDGKAGLSLSSKGLYEYEVIPSADGSSTDLALTLMRCVGWLSRPDLRLRQGNAGPQIPTPDAQCLGTWDFEYSFFPFSLENGSVPDFDFLADAYQVPPLVLPRKVSFLPWVSFFHIDEVGDDEILTPPTKTSFLQVSSLRLHPRLFSHSSCMNDTSSHESEIFAELRLYNTKGTGGKARISSFLPLKSVKKTELSGNLSLDQPKRKNGNSNDTAWEFSFGPYEIVTLVMGV